MADSRSWKCAECLTSFPKSKLLEIHSRQSKHKAYKCTKDPVCRKTFQLRTAMIRHESAHTAQKKHVCQLCGKPFYRRDHCQEHESICSQRQETHAMDATNHTRLAEPADTEAASLLTEMRNGNLHPQPPREHWYSGDQIQSSQVESKSPWRDSVFVEWKDDATVAEYETPEEMQKKDPLGTQIWRLYNKQKGQLPNGERLENLTWRMMSMNLRRKEIERQGMSARSRAQNAPSDVTQLHRSSEQAKDGWDQLIEEFQWMDYTSPAKLKPQPESVHVDAVLVPNYSLYFDHPTAAEDVSPTSPFFSALPDARLDNTFPSGRSSPIQAFGNQREPGISSASEPGNQDATLKLKDRLVKLERLLESMTAATGADNCPLNSDVDADGDKDGSEKGDLNLKKRISKLENLLTSILTQPDSTAAKAGSETGDDMRYATAARSPEHSPHQLPYLMPMDTFDANDAPSPLQGPSTHSTSHDGLGLDQFSLSEGPEQPQQTESGPDKRNLVAQRQALADIVRWSRSSILHRQEKSPFRDGSPLRPQSTT